MQYKTTKKGSSYAVLEIPTKLVIKTYPKATPANTLCKQLNSGAGFRGLTPHFMTESIRKRAKA